MRFVRFAAPAALALMGALALTAEAKPSKEEMDTVVSAAFAQADVDGNGALSAEEFTNFHMIVRQQLAAARFNRADTNGDGQVTLEELQQARQNRGHCGGRRGQPDGE
jgi:environmental stress-induced protein Ves